MVQSPVAADGNRLWLGTTKRDAPFRDGQVVCLDAGTGERVWQTNTGATGSMGGPCVGDDTVFAPSGLTCSLFALDRASGRLRWKYPTDEAIWGAPALADGQVCFVGDQGTLYALDATSGSEVWRVKLSKPPCSSVTRNRKWGCLHGIRE